MALNACSAFVRICALPTLMPADSSPFGNKLRLKFPSLILFLSFNALVVDFVASRL